jgi:antitoxin ParD1/3/4
MNKVTVTLPEPLAAFVEERVASEGYGGPDEYLRELIRRDRDRHRLRGLLVEGAASGQGEIVDDVWFARLRDVVRTAGAV